jgi:hypothetical protein
VAKPVTFYLYTIFFNFTNGCPANLLVSPYSCLAAQTRASSLSTPCSRGTCTAPARQPSRQYDQKVNIFINILYPDLVRIHFEWLLFLKRPEVLNNLNTGLSSNRSCYFVQILLYIPVPRYCVLQKPRYQFLHTVLVLVHRYIVWLDC